MKIPFLILKKEFTVGVTMVSSTLKGFWTYHSMNMHDGEFKVHSTITDEEILAQVKDFNLLYFRRME